MFGIPKMWKITILIWDIVNYRWSNYELNNKENNF